MSKQGIKSTDENITYQGKIVEVVEWEVEVVPGKVKTFEKARRSPGIRLIIPVGTDEILLTKEHRHELDQEDIRLPGGKVFDKLTEYNKALARGDNILAAATEKAKGEGREEAGIAITDLHHFHTSRVGATVEWDLEYFIVDSFARVDQELEEGENAEPIIVSREEARAMCLDGRISEERSALVLLRYLSSGA